MRALLATLVLLGPPAAAAPVPSELSGGAADLPAILPLRERAAVRDRWLAERLDALVPELMRRAGVDCWVLVARESNEDPVVETMLPATWLAARRRTILVFHEPGAADEREPAPATSDGRESAPATSDGRESAPGAADERESAPGTDEREPARSERFAVSRYAIDGLFPAAWDPEAEPDQWRRLAALLAERDPRRIALNVSPTLALADGLSHGEHQALLAALPPALRERTVSAEPLCVAWLATRLPEEIEAYRHACRLAHGVIREGLSRRAIQPGVTTTEDLKWWFRERLAALDLETWFHPLVSLQRRRAVLHTGSFAAIEAAETIRPGDLLHVDLGIVYLGLHTDTQHHAYVLRPGESAPPPGLVAGLRAGNRLQDLLTERFAVGRTGDDVLAATLAAARAEGLAPTIYSHPIGLHGHAAGPLIGLWDRQGGVPGRGELALAAKTCWAIELAVAHAVPEWDGQEVRFMLEEDAVFDRERVTYLDGRQTELTLIR